MEREASTVTAALFLENLTLGVVLVCIGVFIQVALTFLVLRLYRRFAHLSSSARATLAMAVLILTILFGHLLQISVWAVAFYGCAFFEDFWSAQYFVAETYTTLGYGDLLLPPDHRMLAGWLAITGLLMVGWSTALFAYLIAKYHDAHAAILDRSVGGHDGRSG